MKRPVVFLFAAWLLVACRTPGAAPASKQAEVSSLSLRFPEPDVGELSFVVAMLNRTTNAGTILEVDYELWLDGRWFAAGRQRVSTVLPLDGAASVELKVPLAFRRVGYQSETRSVQVGLRGGALVSFGGEERRLRFEEVRRMSVVGAPEWETAEE